MEKLELPAITTFDEARAAMAAFDARYWKHAPGLPTVRHTMIHLYKSLDEGVYFDSDKEDVSLMALSGLALEHAARLANLIPRFEHDFDAWYTKDDFVLRLEYVEEYDDLADVGWGPHRDLNNIVHDMEEGADLGSVRERLMTPCIDLLHLAMLARQLANGPKALTSRERFGGLEARLAYLYGKYDVNVTFNDPASS